MGNFYAFTAFALLSWGIFLVSLKREPRRLRNGVYLSVALGFSYFAVITMPGLPPTIGLLLGFGLVLVLGPLSAMFLSGFLIINGVTMLRREGRSLGNLLSLLAGLAIIGVGMTAVIVVSGRANAALIASCIVIVLLAGYLGFLLFSFLVYALVYSKLPYRGAPDFVIVLGSGLIGDRVPPLLASRLLEAQQIHARSRAAGAPSRIIVTGGQGADEDRSEAAAMAEYLVNLGVPADEVLLEDQARNTEENLSFSKAIMDAEAREYSSIVVTNNFHVFRAALLAKRKGLDTQAVGSKTAGYFLPSAALREFIGLLAMYKWLHLAFAAVVVGGILALFVFSLQRSDFVTASAALL